MIATAFTPAALERARKGVDMAESGLVPVNDPEAWKLYREHVGGFRHSWEHKATGWLSQTLTVPRWALESAAGRKAAG